MEPTPGGPPMAPAMYALLDSISDTYWRYVARRELFRDVWRRDRVPRDSYRVLDVGCGTGAVLNFLSDCEPLTAVGVDLFPGTLQYCRQRGLTQVSVADAMRLPFRDRGFDFVVCQDVVEHLADDRLGLFELHRVCAPQGLALVLAPAFRFLWSSRDLELGHQRRYTLGELAEKMRSVGFEVVRQTYTDAFLLPLIWAAIRLAPHDALGVAQLPENAAPGGRGILNRLLLAFSRLESGWALRRRLPFGVSALVLGRRRSGGGAPER